MEVVNERLLNWNGDQAALEILKSFLYDGKVGESSAHDVTHSGNNERSKLSIIQVSVLQEVVMIECHIEI